MGKRGPKPEPTALKVLKGGQDSPDEPKPAKGDVTCPSWLPPKGKAFWREHAPDLIAKGVLTPWDRQAFAGVCWWWAKWREAQDLVDRDGVLVDGYRGSQVKHPAHQVARDAWEKYLQAVGHFGLTPSTRAELGIGGKQDGPKAERLLS